MICAVFVQASLHAIIKSDEKAEKRKKYYMKLEEKLHAKEVEINEIQAKTQEGTQAAIKQLRRTLNFKATPVPSFYHDAVPKVSGGRKKVAPPPYLKGGKQRVRVLEVKIPL